MAKARISVITVCYNSVSTIQATFESVLKQTYLNFEYIVVDGNSIDGTISIVKEYESQFDGKMRWISEPDEGLYDAMNKGIEMARGDVIGILNSDDVFFNSQVLEHIVSSFDLRSDIDAVYGNLYYVAQNNISTIIRKWITGEQAKFETGWHPAHPALYIKKNVYEMYGKFNLRYRIASDFEIMLRFIDKHHIKLIYLNEILVKMRLGGKTNRSFRNIFVQNVEILKAFRENKIYVNYLTYSIKRLAVKLLQYRK